MTNAQADPLPRLPPRQPDAHKGDFGLALVVGGSRGMAGAVGLGGLAAPPGGGGRGRVGAGGGRVGGRPGLVRLPVPESILDSVAGLEPSYMTAPLPADANGRI